MALRGDLASVDLAQVFQMLALNKKVGLLSIQSDTQRRVLYFDERGVTVHHNPHRLLERVVASAVRSGRVDEASVEEVRDHSVRMGHSLGESLLAGGYLQPEELDELYADGREIPEADLRHVRDLIWKHLVVYAWRTGDVVAIDNRSVSHGRLPYKGPRQIAVAWA